MRGSTDLGEIAEIASLSTSFSRAAISLENIAYKKILSSDEVRNLQRTAELIGQIDWNGPYYGKTNDGLVVMQATKLRPDYLRLQRELQFEPTSNYTKRLYETMYSGGMTVTLFPSELETTKKVLKRMSEDLLVSIHQGNI